MRGWRVNSSAGLRQALNCRSACLVRTGKASVRRYAARKPDMATESLTGERTRTAYEAFPVLAVRVACVANEDRRAPALVASRRGFDLGFGDECKERLAQGSRLPEGVVGAPEQDVGAVDRAGSRVDRHA